MSPLAPYAFLGMLPIFFMSYHLLFKIRFLFFHSKREAINIGSIFTFVVSSRGYAFL